MAKKNPWNQFFIERLQKAKDEDRFRSMRTFDSFLPGYVLHGERRILNLCSNDYLGLAADAETKEEARVLGEILPVGAGASRLIAGNLALHDELEKALANWKGTESARVFPSGFQTNIGLFASLMGKGDAIFSDKLNHASIIDGCLLSGAAFYRYKHCDLEGLVSLLKSKRSKKRLIVTDGVFSMEGDIAPLAELAKIARRYSALLVIDDAHGTGVLGPEGAGSWKHAGLEWNENVILMGTLSKAIGVQGGYICASERIVQYLTNYCRPMIYSTGLSPLLAGLAHFNINRIRTEERLLQNLRTAMETMRGALKSHGLDIPDGETPIIPLILGENEKAVRCADALFEKNILALAIRPPTVPEGQARLRISVSAAHDPAELEQAAEVIAGVVRGLDRDGHGN